MIGRNLSHFRVVDKLGEGGMGVVYRAEDSKLGRQVAIKVLPAEVAADPERLARFEREARVLASLNHQNIAAIHDVQELEGQQLLILELVEGEGLDERIARGPLGLDEALDIAGQIAEALEAAHERGVIHRDLKPANVKITPEGRVKVLDFGLAKAVEADDGTGSAPGLSHSPTLTANMTAAGMLMGTAAYMSPEQARGHAADKRADVWAFGCVFFEMLTGRQSFREDTVSDTLAAVLKTDLSLDTLPAGTPERVRRLVRRCLEKDPRQRLRDIGEARIAIERARAEPEAEPVSATAGAPPVQRTGGSPLPWVLVGLLAVVSLGLGMLWLTSETSSERRIVRATVTAAAGTRFELDSAHPGAAALSPNGSRMVFAARDANGAVGLWMRDLDTLDARPLTGTDGGGYPFWSPDGAYVGFFADGKLRKIDIDGGAVLSLCDAPNGKGGAWSDTGVIVFAPDPRSTIHRVSEAGGDPESITELDSERGELSHRHPRMLPDGKHFVYLSRVGTGREHVEKNRLQIESVDGEKGRVLVRSESQGQYAAGHLLYVRENVLMAQPFDPAALKTIGNPFPLVEKIAFVRGASLGLFSATDDVLTYVSGDVGSRGAQLSWVDRSGQMLETIGEVASYGELALATDESFAVVQHSDSEGASDLWVWDLERQIRNRFTFAEGSEYAVAIAHDDSRVAYAAIRDGNHDVYVKSLEGVGDEELLLQSPLREFPTGWSPDGSRLTFAGYDPVTTDTGVWFYDLDTDERSPINAVPGFVQGYPSVSPDGGWLVYASNESGRFEIYATAFPAGGRKWQLSTAGGTQPRFRADGREVYYIVPGTQMLEAVELEVRGNSLRVGRPVELFPGPFHDDGIKYHPSGDGQRFLVLQAVLPETPNSMTLVMNWPLGLGR